MTKRIEFKTEPFVGSYQSAMVIVLDSLPNAQKTGVMRQIIKLADKIESATDYVDLEPDEYRSLTQAIEAHDWQLFNPETGKELPVPIMAKRAFVAFEDYIKDAPEAPNVDEKDAA